MIQLRNISKSYGTQVIFDNFNYDFLDCKFYLIYGYSGCGKTTLINMIMNITPCDTGEVYLNGKLTQQMNSKELLSEIAYMTQDSYFIDYLTIEEHLRMNIETFDKALKLFKEFALEYTLCQYPSSLSGGEKQRISIIKALAEGKKVLILDEPTSSLDLENKERVFSFLEKIRRKVLVICISHDEQAKGYCDEMLDFNQGHIDKQVMDVVSKESELSKRKLTPLYPFVKRKHKKERDKKNKIILALVFVVFFMLLSSCINPEEKLINSLGEQYHLNYLNVEISIDKMEEALKELEKNKGVKDIVYQYGKGGDYHTPIYQGSVDVGNTELVKTLVFETLPLSDSFYMRDELVAGNYFTFANEVMLGYDYALKMTTNIESLVDREIELVTGFGKETFTIAGVFKRFEDKSFEYFKGSSASENINMIGFFNEAYSEKYLKDDKLSLYEKQEPYRSNFTVYFDQFSDLISFQEKYQDVDLNSDDLIYVATLQSQLISQINELKTIAMIAIPIAILAIIVSLLFYIQTNFIKLDKNVKEFAVYEYYGYDWKEIRNSYWKYHLAELFKILLSSSLLSILILLLINLINFQLQFYAYTIFMFDALLIIVPIIIFMLGALFNFIMMQRFKKIKWYDIIKERRDLL